MRKEGSGFDLPMALAILGAYSRLDNASLQDALFVGELSLNGGLRGVRRAPPIAITARANNIHELMLAEINARGAAVVTEFRYIRYALMDVAHMLNTGNGVQPLRVATHALRMPTILPPLT